MTATLVSDDEPQTRQKQQWSEILRKLINNIHKAGLEKGVRDDALDKWCGEATVKFLSMDREGDWSWAKLASRIKDESDFEQITVPLSKLLIKLREDAEDAKYASVMSKWSEKLLKLIKPEEDEGAFLRNDETFAEILAKLKVVEAALIENESKHVLEKDAEGRVHVTADYEPQALFGDLQVQTRPSSAATITPGSAHLNALSHYRRIGLRQAALREMETSGIESRHGGLMMV